MLVNCSSQMQLISKLLFTQYGIYMELFLLFWLSRVLGTSTFSGRDECSGVTCACTCLKRRNINIVIHINKGNKYCKRVGKAYNQINGGSANGDAFVD